MSLAENSIRELLEELVTKLDADATPLQGNHERALVARVAGHILKIPKNRSLVRPLMPDEEQYFAESPLIHPVAPTFAPISHAGKLELLHFPDDTTRLLFKSALNLEHEDGRQFQILRHAVLLENVLLPAASTRLVNILLQRGGSISGEGSSD